MGDHVKSDLPAYFNGDLSESKRQQVEEHLGDCAACRSAANSIRSKASRGKRQALKNASPDPVPNLLLTRLGRQSFGSPRPPSTPWGAIVAVLVVLGVGGAAWYLHHTSHWKNIKALAAAHFSAAPVIGSSAAVSGFEVARSSPGAAAAVVAAGAAAAPSATESSATATAAASAESASPTTPPQWSGEDSPISEAREVVVRGRAAWRTLWDEMGQPRPAPHVNFNDFVVIGIFAGERSPGHYQITFGAPIDQDDAVIIPYKVSGPVAGAGGVTSPAHPYFLTTVQRSPKPIRFRSETP